MGSLKNVTSSWKSSLVGAVLIIVSLLYLFFKDGAELLTFSVVMGIGITLLFIPDSLFNGIKSLINKKSKEI